MPDYESTLPRRMHNLPRDSAGRPVPKFVEWIDGKPDFRVMDSRHFARALRHRVCWVCDEPLGARVAFTIGPMCIVNRVAAEPPAHYDCAEYSAKLCPFLNNPDKVRREANLPEEGLKEPAGVMVMRNPGVTAVAVTRQYRPFRAPNGGVLVSIGEPERVEWYARGRSATPAEVAAAVDSGLPALRASCDGDPYCNAALDQQLADAQRWFP